MTRHTIQNSFNGGAVSPRLFGRTDTAIYDIALSEMVNFAPTVEGPAIKRSGWRIADLCIDGASAAIPFEFNASQAYVLEFSAGLVRFYDNNGALLHDGGGVPISLAVPYSAADAPAINWQQSADVLYLAHPSYPMAKISRTGATSFTYTVLALSGGPFDDQNSDKSLTVTVSGGTTVSGITTSGTVTLTASSAIFLPGHVGSLFQLQATDFASFPLWGPGMETTASVVWRWEGKLYQNIGGTTRTGATPPTHTTGSAWDGTNTNDVNAKQMGALWAYLCDAYGQVQITATGSGSGPSTTATATVQRAIPPATGSWRWNFARFSAARGYAKNVIIWNNRLVFFTDFEVIGSVVGDYLNFSAFDDTGRLQADLAFRLRINGSNPINWCAVDLQLMIGTDRAEWTIGAINSQQAPSSTNLGVNRQSHHGSLAVRPVQTNVKTIFVQRGGRKLREASFDLSENRYIAPNITIWCRHLMLPGIKRIGYQQESEEILWALRSDGRLLLHAYSPEQQIKGWAEAPIAGFAGAEATVIDFCVIPSAAGSPDMVFAIVDRGGHRTMEVLGDWWTEGTDIRQAQFLDGCLNYAGAPATSIGVGGTGFPAHFHGQAVTALADGFQIDGLTVASDGSVTLPSAASQVCIGLLPEARMSGMPAKLAVREGGQAELHKKRLITVLARCLDSAGLWVGGFGRTLAELLRRPQPATWDTPLPLYTGVSNETKVMSSTDRDGVWTLESRAPLPAIVPMIRCMWQAEESD